MTDSPAPFASQGHDVMSHVAGLTCCAMHFRGVEILSEACGILDPQICKLMLMELVAAGASINGMSPRVRAPVCPSYCKTHVSKTCFLLSVVGLHCICHYWHHPGLPEIVVVMLCVTLIANLFAWLSLDAGAVLMQVMHIDQDSTDTVEMPVCNTLHIVCP